MTKKEVLRKIAEAYRVIDEKEDALFDEFTYLLEQGEKEDAKKVHKELQEQKAKRFGVLTVASQFGYEVQHLHQEAKKIQFEINVAKLEAKGIQL